MRYPSLVFQGCSEGGGLSSANVLTRVLAKVNCGGAKVASVMARQHFCKQISSHYRIHLTLAHVLKCVSVFVMHLCMLCEVCCARV